jgi:glycine cleavage system transcriptional repressor
MQQLQQPQLVVCALGEFKAEVLSQFTQTCQQNQCQLLNAKGLLLGKELALTLHISGHWSAIAKLESQLSQLASKHQYQLEIKRTEPRSFAASIPYLVHVSCQNKPEVAALVTDFFTSQKIVVHQFSATNYPAPVTHTPMMAISMSVLIPADTHLADLRESFILYCDEHNLDAVFEPDRN